MTIIHELNVWDYEPWSGAVDTYERISNAGKLGLLDQILDEIYDSESMTDTQLNDLLWFEPDTVYEWLGMKTDEQIEEERKDRAERRNKLAELAATDDAAVFCHIWSNDLNLPCNHCPLFYAADCDDPMMLVACRDDIETTIQDLQDELDDEEEEETI